MRTRGQSIVLCAVVAMALAGRALAAEPGYGALDIHARLDALTDDQRATYHIAQARWAAADDVVAVDYAYLLGSLDGVPTYNDGGWLVVDGLPAPPTSYVLRVPQAWNGRLIVIIPGGSAAHTRFFDWAARLMERGFAVVTMNHPTAGFPGFPWEVFWEPPSELHIAYLSCT